MNVPGGVNMGDVVELWTGWQDYNPIINLNRHTVNVLGDLHLPQPASDCGSRRAHGYSCSLRHRAGARGAPQGGASA